MMKCQTIGCPNDAFYYIKASYLDLVGIRVALCKQCVTKSKILGVDKAQAALERVVSKRLEVLKRVK